MPDNIDKWLEDHRQEIIDELAAWVSIRSVADTSDARPGAPFGEGCAKMLKYALSRGSEKGFAVENHDGYAGSIYWGDQSSEIGIVAHLDVVPEGNDWLNSPYEPTVVTSPDGAHCYLVGRGSSDNKGMGVMGLYAMQCMRDLGLPLKHRIRLMLGTDEENGMNDMKYMAERAEDPNSDIHLPALTLVPDAGFPVCYAQKGRMITEIVLQCGDDLLAFEGGNVPNQVPDRARAVLRDVDDLTIEELRLDQSVKRINHGVLIESTGRSAHAASPDGSINAIYKLACALLETNSLSPQTQHAMRAIKHLLSDNYGTGAGIACEDDITGRLTFVCGMARFNAGRITLTMDCRYPVTVDKNLLRAKLCIHTAHLGAVIKKLDIGTTFYMEETDSRIQALTRAYRDVTGDTASQNYTMGGGTYSKVLPNAITFGGGFHDEMGAPRLEMPEGHGGAHSPDEYISLDDLFKCIKIYVNAIVKLDSIVA